MSYCHLCGGASKIAYTFGGQRDESGRWQNADITGETSIDSSRVPETMYKHVSSQGTCSEPTHNVPSQTCGGLNCDDKNACTNDFCSGGKCISTPTNCDDANRCTIDSCDSISGCKNEPVRDSSFFELFLVTDKYGGETSWDLLSVDESEVIASGDGYASLSTYDIKFPICLHPCYKFVIIDSWGDGMCCKHGEGGWSIKVDGEEVASGSSFDTEETYEFCRGGSRQTDTPSFSPSRASPMPSVTPSIVSSTAPSPAPSPAPSIGPSVGTSIGPSIGPSTMPSTNRAASTAPTRGESSTPSKSPMETPSRPPTRSPSMVTTTAPSFKPTKSNSNATWNEIFFSDFEVPRKWGAFFDGRIRDGDARRYGRGGAFVHSGVGSIRLRDNSDVASSVYTEDYDIGAYQMLRVDYWFYARSMDNKNENFLLEFSDNGGASWEIVKSWAKDIDFQNDVWYEVIVDFDASAIDVIRIRFRCDASNNGDVVYIDDVRFSGK